VLGEELLVLDDELGVMRLPGTLRASTPTSSAPTAQ